MSTPYWTLAIARAKKRGRFTMTERNRAQGWVTCACGKQDPRVPRQPQHRDPSEAAYWEVGEPLDDRLHLLGLEFNAAVYDNDTLGAERILAKIEKRAAEVLAGMEE